VSSDERAPEIISWAVFKLWSGKKGRRGRPETAGRRRRPAETPPQARHRGRTL